MVRSYEEIKNEDDLKWINYFEQGLLVDCLEGKGEYGFIRERNPRQSEYLKYSRYIQDRDRIIGKLESLNGKYNKEWPLSKMVSDALHRLKKVDKYVFMDTVWVLLRDFAFCDSEGLPYLKGIFEELNEEFSEHVGFLSALHIDDFELANGYEEIRDYIKPLEFKLAQMKVDLRYLQRKKS